MPLSHASTEMIHFPSREAPGGHLVLAPEDTAEEIKLAMVGESALLTP